MYTRASWGEAEFVVVDTGGLMSDAVKLPPRLHSLTNLPLSSEFLCSIDFLYRRKSQMREPMPACGWWMTL